MKEALIVVVLLLIALGVTVVIVRTLVIVQSPTVVINPPAPPTQGEGNLVLVNLGPDQVGKSGNPHPNGEPDGHFRLTVSVQGQRTVIGMIMTSSDPQGKVRRTWDTIHKTTGHWPIGVFRNDKRLNPNDENLYDSVDGIVQYDLYADGVKYFSLGYKVLVVVNFAEGGEYTARPCSQNKLA